MIGGSKAGKPGLNPFCEIRLALLGVPAHGDYEWTMAFNPHIVHNRSGGREHDWHEGQTLRRHPDES